MLRQDIRIGDYSERGSDLVTYKYIADLYKAGIDFTDDIRKQWVMIRKYDVMNGLVYDTDLYIIEKEVLENTTNDIVFPMTNKTFVGFSNDKTVFNSNLNDDNFKEGGFEVYDLMKSNGDRTFSVANVPCDIIRIYHPHNRAKLKSIIYADAIAGNVKVHILCKPYLSLEPHAEEDFEIDGIRYSEYVECYVPDLEWVFSGQCYYEERLNLVKTCLTVNGEEVESSIVCTPQNHLSLDRTYVAMMAFTLPFYIDDKDNSTDGSLVKRYIVNTNGTVKQDYIEYPVRITIYPYDYIDSLTGIYINSSNLSMNCDVMQGDAKMTLAAQVAFDDNHNPSMVCRFQFPAKEKFKSFREAYEYFYNVDLDEYTGIVEYDEEDVDEEDYVEQKQCGFILYVYTDYEMKSLLTTEIFELDNPSAQLDDFAFQLNGMFSNWGEFPDTLIMETRFMDRWLGNVIASNPVIVTTESFKYIINEDYDKRTIIRWDNKENTPKSTDDMDLSYINFIDKIQCTVRRKYDDNTSVNGNSQIPRVIYKPVFYRTQDLQNIKLHSGLVQNIGIALAEYMTKVETFKLVINGQDIAESARNDIYAIFSVNAQGMNMAQGESGTYHITNQDGEYISSGTYTIIA